MMMSKAPHKVLSSIPSPQSGIKLIEYISLRMHTLKGSVIAKNPTYSVPQEKSQGLTIPPLTLKPPTTVAYSGGFGGGGNGYVGGKDLERESSSDKKVNEEQKSRKRSDDAGRSDSRSALGDDAASGTFTAGPLAYGRRQSSAMQASNSHSKKEGSAYNTPRGESTASVYGRMANGKMGQALAGLGGTLKTT